MSDITKDREQAIEQFIGLLNMKRHPELQGELNVSAFSRTENKIFVMHISEFDLK